MSAASRSSDRWFGLQATQRQPAGDNRRIVPAELADHRTAGWPGRTGRTAPRVALAAMAE